MQLQVENYNLGIQAYKANEFQKAVTYLTKAIEDNSWMEFSQAHRIRGHCYIKTKEYEKAIRDLNIVEKVIKDDYQIYYNRGQVYQMNRDLEMACTDYEKAISMKFDLFDAYERLINIYGHLKKFENAIEIACQLIKIQPSSGAYYLRAKCYKNLGKELEAYFDYKKGIEKNPNDFNCLTQLATLASKFGNYEEAIIYQTKIIEVSEFKSMYLFNRGITKKKIGDQLGYILDIKASKEKGFTDPANEEMEKNPDLFNREFLLFFDVETTGIPKNWKAPVTDIENWPRIVQIAWSIYDTKGQEFETKSFIIKPEGFAIPKESSKIHGITTERALNEGVQLQQILSELSERIRNSDMLIAHNISFDSKVLGAEFLRNGIENWIAKKRLICTMESTTNILQIPGSYGYKWPKLQELYFFLFKNNFSEAHNAKADIIATAECFWELKERKLI